MKKLVGLLSGFSVFIILVGAGCVAPKNSVSDSVKVDQESSVEDRGVESEKEVEAEDSDDKVVDPGIAAEVKTDVSFTMDDVSKHNTPESCYIVVRDLVYDVTKFTDKHPGGSDKIIPLCGKDATVPFTQVHGGKQPQENVLAGMQIGVLKK